MATPYVKQTWVDGDITKPLSAARLGVIETGVFDAHYRPCVSVYNSAALTLTTAVATVLTFNTELYDTDAMHSTVSNTGRLVAPVAGKYAIAGRNAWVTNGTGLRTLTIRLNGTTLIDQFTSGASAGNAIYGDVGRHYQLAASDYVEMLATQTSGGNLATGSGISDLHFEMALVSY